MNIKPLREILTNAYFKDLMNVYKNQPDSAGTWKRAGDPKEYIVQDWGAPHVKLPYLVMCHPEGKEPPRELDKVEFVAVGKGPEWYKLSEKTKEFLDPVNHPPHYKAHPSGIECIQITEHMDFLKGNAIKYIWRAGSKGSEIEDLEKAIWYLERRIAQLTNS